MRCDAGPHGFLSIAAHGHADALSVEARYGGVDILADPGTYCYHGEPAVAVLFPRHARPQHAERRRPSTRPGSAGPFLWLDRPSGGPSASRCSTGRCCHGRRSMTAIAGWPTASRIIAGCCSTAPAARSRSRIGSRPARRIRWRSRFILGPALDDAELDIGQRHAATGQDHSALHPAARQPGLAARIAARAIRRSGGIRRVSASACRPGRLVGTWPAAAGDPAAHRAPLPPARKGAKRHAKWQTPRSDRRREPAGSVRPPGLARGHDAGPQRVSRVGDQPEGERASIARTRRSRDVDVFRYPIPFEARGGNRALPPSSRGAS